MPRIRRAELIALLVLALASVLAAWALLSWFPTGLVGRYWDNATWTDGPIAESAGSVPMAADILRHVPAAARGAASAEWAGFLLVDEAGWHTFDLLSDDGAWLYVDDVLVADNGGTHDRQSVRGHVELSAGHHRMRVRYFQEGGELALALRWTRPGGRPELVQRDDLAPQEPPAGRQRLRPVLRVLPIALPVVWGCLFLYIPVRLTGWWMWREVERATPRAGDRRSLLLVLCVAVGLLVWSIQWGGQFGDGWAPDELPPDRVRDALQSGFSGGWHDKYPLLHFAVMAIPVSAFELASRFGILAADSLVPAYAAQLLLMRAVSVLMGLGALVAAFLCGVELWGPRRAIFAPIALLLTPQFVFYGKAANLDVPMLCWFGWALLAFLRMRRANRLADYVLLGVAAAGAVATKDQAYANFALLPIAVVAANARHQAASTWWRRLGSAVVDVKIWTAGLAAALASVVFHNVVFNLDGFVAHLTLLLTFDDLAVVPRTVAGYMDLSSTTVTLFRFVAGWPLFVLAIVGLAGAAARPGRRWWLWLLLVPLSFHLTFTWVTLYVNDRYLFGGAFVLALFAGSACADLLETSRWRHVARGVVAGSLVYSLLYAVSINVMLHVDARETARQWVYAHASKDTTVGLVGDYLPYLGPPVRSMAITSSDAVRSAEPGFIMVNARFAQRFAAERRPDGRDLLRGLEDGSLGYTEVFRLRGPVPAWALLRYEAPFRGTGESPLTNLDKVNPEMVIYRRNGP